MGCLYSIALDSLLKPSLYLMTTVQKLAIQELVWNEFYILEKENSDAMHGYILMKCYQMSHLMTKEVLVHFMPVGTEKSAVGYSSMSLPKALVKRK